MPSARRRDEVCVVSPQAAHIPTPMLRLAGRLLRALAVLVALLVGAAGVAGLAYRPNTEIPEGAPGKHVLVNGVPIRVLQQGSGPDVLLIHGSPGSIEDWKPVVDALAGSMRVTAFDRPGHGYSADTGRYSYEDNADTALALVDALKLEHVVVVGHSYGGTTALAMAARSPATIDAFVVLDSAAYAPSREPDFTLRLLDVPVLGVGFGALTGSLIAPAKIRKGLIEQFSGRTPPEEFIALRTRIWSTPKVTHAIAVETLAAAESLRALSPKYPSIRRPVFIVAEADSEFRRTTAERLHGDIPGSTLELLSNTGHYVQLEKTADVVRTIRRAAGQSP
jgi:pimeloyl-ACP methyl ester carboxylesterase